MTAKLFSTVLLLCWMSSAKAYTVFNTNCDLPSASVNYVTSANTRGSLDIIWSCTGVIVACVYSILHLNIPRRAEHVTFNSLDDHKDAILQWRRQGMPFMTSLFAVIGPEMIFAFAAAEFFSARKELKLLERDVPGTKGKWNLAHMFFADMGGYVVLYKENRVKKGETAEKTLNQSKSSKEDIVRDKGVTKSFSTSPQKDNPLPDADKDESRQQPAADRADQPTPSAIGSNVSSKQPPIGSAAEEKAGGSSPLLTNNAKDRTAKQQSRPSPAADEEKSPNDAPQNSEPWSNQTMDHEYLRFHLNAAVYRVAMTSGLLPSTAIPSDELEDRSKGDWFAKAVIIFQLCSFFITVLARAAESLPVSPLEVSVCAFAACSVVTYGFLWAKPKNAFVPVVVARCHYLPEEIQELKVRYLSGDYLLNGTGKDNRVSRAKDNADFPGRPPDVISPPGNGNILDNKLIWLSGLVFAMVFGSIHIAGWNLDYPSAVDKWLWRASSIATAAIPPLWTAIAFPFLRTYEEKISKGEKLSMFNIRTGMWTIGILSTGYAAARIILIVETIRTLLYLPPRAYATPSWPISIPHIG